MHSGRECCHQATNHEYPLILAGKIYKTHLVVPDGQVIDAIPRMSWMRDHKALLDNATCTMHLVSPVHGTTVLHLLSPFIPTASVHHTTTKKLEDNPVACEFPYVFPNDLPWSTTTSRCRVHH
jgi:hypothetical protein